MIPLLAIFSDYALLALRLALGSLLLAHTIPKIKNIRGTAEWFGSVGFRPGVFWGFVAIAIEGAGGIMLLTGIFTQIAAFFVALEFLIIIGWRLIRREKFVSGWELDALVFATALILVTIGGGIYSLEGWLFLSFS